MRQKNTIDMKVKLHRTGRTEELDLFISDARLPEPFGYDAPLIFEARNKGKLVFINAFRLEPVNSIILPRFIHIILGDSIKRSRTAIDLMKQAENYLTLLGYDTSFAYINKQNRVMSVLAQKFGYKKDKEDEKAIYYFKRIGGNTNV